MRGRLNEALAGPCQPVCTFPSAKAAIGLGQCVHARLACDVPAARSIEASACVPARTEMDGQGTRSVVF